MLAGWYGVAIIEEPEEVELRRLSALWELRLSGQAAHLDMAELRRSVPMLARALGLSGDVLQRRLADYDVLDCSSIDPRTWLADLRRREAHDHQTETGTETNTNSTAQEGSGDVTGGGANAL